MNKRFLLKNGEVIHHDRIGREDVLVSGERIEKVAAGIELDEGIQVIECAGRLIFPGIIDSHTHMGVPIKGGYSADNFETGSRAALHGGVTTIIDFTVLNENQTLMESFNERLSRAEKSLVDYGIHCNVTRLSPDLLKEIPALVDMGVISFKVFTTYRSAGMMLSYPQIEQVAREVARSDGVLMVHAEDDAVLQQAAEPFLASRSTLVSDHARTRPAAAEVEAINRVGNILQKTNCRGYVVHLTSAAGLTAAANFPDLALETCPQYLFFDEAVFDCDDGRMFVASPPIKRRDDRAALWQAINDGTIHTIGTDHCPFNLADKASDIPFQEIPNGMGGVETLFPVLLARFLAEGKDLCQLVRLLSTHPAEIFGLAPRKGSLDIGSDADIVIVNPKRVSKGWDRELASITDWNGYSGLPALFPEHVFRRGEWIVQDGHLRAASPGRFVPGHT
ncbi:dihydroorotase family protein [Candidatus Neomarinimicrobiota bacterium]